MTRLSAVATAQLYDALFEQASALLRDHNPCQIHTNDAGETLCAGHSPSGWCCEGCEHLTPAGCGVDVKPLACRVWLCQKVADRPKNKPVVIALRALRQTGVALGIPLDYDYVTLRKSRTQILTSLRAVK